MAQKAIKGSKSNFQKYVKEPMEKKGVKMTEIKYKKKKSK